MTSAIRERQILCIGKDTGLLRSRCAVLQHAGYAAKYAMFHQTHDALQEERFDLIILSAILTDPEREVVRSIAGINTPILALRKMTLASDLLAEVDSYLPASSLA